jgi:hypothetical protein
VRWAPGPVCCTALLLVCLELKSNSYNYRAELLLFHSCNTSDNGQVAVFGVLAKGRFATAIDTRLYLPKEWTEDAERCHKAGIPESERVFKTKSQLALDIVEQARRNGVRFGWVGTDAGYGSGPDFWGGSDIADRVSCS